IHVDVAGYVFSTIGLVVRRSCGSLVSGTGKVFQHHTNSLLLEFMVLRQILYIVDLRSEDSCSIFSDCAEADKLLFMYSTNRTFY
ncbi:hypothetical protein LINGRAHAP2_LOCUS28078, partial [Linum grandiflorum]